MNEQCEQRANGRAGGPVLQSVFLAVLDHGARGYKEINLKVEIRRIKSERIILCT